MQKIEVDSYHSLSYSQWLNGYWDKGTKPLVSIMPKINGYVKTFKDEDKNNILMSFCIDHELLDKYQAIWAKIELNILAVYDDR